MIRISCFLTSCLLFVSAAGADPYWIAYEGNGFPENEGWSRITNGPLAERRIEDGALVVDTTEDRHTCDWYEMYPDITAPEAEEEFILQWRLKIEEFTGGGSGATVGVFSDERWGVTFTMSHDTIISSYDPGVSAPFEPDIYHEYELRSPDMRTYELFIDGMLTFEGSFWQSVWTNKVVWGEGNTASACLSSWDYFRLGVIPEPNTGIALFVLSLALTNRHVRR